MFRFTIRDVLWLTVVVALAVGWWVEHNRGDARRRTIVAQAERLRDALAQARQAFRVVHDNFDQAMKLNFQQGSFVYGIPSEPDWSLADQPINTDTH